MKKLLLSAMLLAGSFLSVKAQSLINVQDSISTNTHWTANNQYLLKGYVYVTNGNTLTIDPGTVIKGDKTTKGTLIIERGAKIIAQGTVSNPIVFTSNRPAGSRTYGDWGGVILCGKAPVNWNGGQAQVEGGPRSFYGGGASPDAEDSSGVVSYVRIEFGGIAFSPNNEVNGLTLCGVGNKTQLDHIQVSYSGDDSFEFFGGTVNGKYLISHRSWDDDFDTDNGFSGKVQYGVVLRNPYAADQSGSKAFESDSYLGGTIDGKTNKDNASKCIFTNMTVIGPVSPSPTSTAYNSQFVAGVHIRRGSSLSLFNSLVVGWPCGILIDESAASYGSTLANIQDSTSEIRNVIVAGTATGSLKKDVFFVKDGARNITPTTTWADTTTAIVCLPNSSSPVAPFAPYAGPYSWFLAKNHNNKILYSEQNNAYDAGLRLTNAWDLTNPSFIPTSTSNIVYNTKALPSYMTTGGADPFHNGKLYPYDGRKPLSTDTTNRFANYNYPNFPADYSNTKLQNRFFDQAPFLGAFGYTGQDSDDWTLGWTEFNPVYADYSITTGTLSAQPDETISAGVAPNPTAGNMTIFYDLYEGGNVKVSLFDLSGKEISEIHNGFSAAGNNAVNFDGSGLTKGIYMIKISNGLTVKTVKVAVN